MQRIRIVEIAIFRFFVRCLGEGGAVLFGGEVGLECFMMGIEIMGDELEGVITEEAILMDESGWLLRSELL